MVVSARVRGATRLYDGDEARRAIGAAPITNPSCHHPNRDPESQATLLALLPSPTIGAWLISRW
jgi:hypothetical protein